MASGFSRRGTLMLAAGGLLAGCGGRTHWPFGGASRPSRAASVPPAGVADGTVILPTIRSAAADRGRQGVILRAEAVAPSQGFYAPELRSLGRGADGYEVVELRARPPSGADPVGPEPARIIQAARFYPPHLLGDLRGFRIVAAAGAVTLPLA